MGQSATSQRVVLTFVGACLLAGCDPFSGIGINERITIPDGQGATVTLLDERRRLPKSATNISGHLRHFQDSILALRFDAPLRDAKAFQMRMLEGKGEACVLWRKEPEVEGWPAQLPENADCLEDKTVDEVGPPITVAIIPNGQVATVFVSTFTM